jgi:hypothetical protein
MLGLCHVCKQRIEIHYCDLCGHWFCAACSLKWGQRLAAFLKHAINPEAACCGPDAMSDAIQLEELDYLRLVLARSHIQAAETAAEAAGRNVQAARASFEKALGVAAAKYGFDATKSHRMDDDTHRLIPE